MKKKQTVAFHTLGCKLNFSETSTISRIMEKEGFEKGDFTDLADVYVINTCSVTDNADKECRQLVRRIQRKSPESFVVITGCYAQLKPKEIAAIPGVDLVLGAAEKFNITQHLKEITKGDSITVTTTITNKGIRDGEEVAELYLTQQVEGLELPHYSLKGFKHVNLKAGESKQVSFKIKSDMMCRLRLHGLF